MDKFRLTECQTLDIPAGNDVPLLVKLVKGFDGCDGEGVVPFPIDVCENVVVAMVSERGQVKSVAHRLGTDGEVLLELQAGDFRAGLTYGIDVRATLNDKAVHAYGKSLVRITAATERGPRQVAQAADPYEVTLYVGYVGDVIPRRLDELEGYDDLMAEVGGKADAAEVGREFQKYIPLAQKAAANGVASLNGDGKIPTAQAQFALRGNVTAADIDSTALQSGFYRIIGQRLGADILGGDEANGVLVQYSDGYKEQVLMVGRTAGADAGEQVETYTRRYLPTPKRWTAWMTTANFAKKEDIVTINERLDDIADDVEHFDAIVPSTASAQNQLADKDFVNHSVATNTAHFIGTFASVAELDAYSGQKTNNDYAFVIEQDAAGNEYYDRYKWNGSAWLFEYRIESTAFTAEQWAAIQSGITSALVTKLQGLENYDDTEVRNAIALIDSTMVTLNGNQDIGGVKKFTHIYGTSIKAFNILRINVKNVAQINYAIYTDISIKTSSFTPIIEFIGRDLRNGIIDSKLTTYFFNGAFNVPATMVLNYGTLIPTFYLFMYGDDNDKKMGIGMTLPGSHLGLTVNIDYCLYNNNTYPTKLWTYRSDNIIYTDETPIENRLFPPGGTDGCVSVKPKTNPQYPSNSQYEALVARVEALEQQVNP